MKKISKIVCGVLSILGCVVGAGFISGAEINSFFIRFGIFGIFGVIFSSVLFGVVIYISAKKYSKTNAKMQKNTKKINFLPFCQIFISGTMVAGLVDVVSQMGINKIVLIFALFVIVYVCLLIGITSANAINIVVSICLFLILPFVIFGIDFNNFSLNLGFDIVFLLPSLFFAVFYVAMNTVASMPIIEHVATIAKKPLAISVISSSVLIVLSLVIFVIIAGTNLGGSSMPMLDIINNKTLKVFYTSLFAVANLSTMLSSSFGANKIFSKFEPKKLCCLLTTMAIFTVSFIGFKNLVNFVYPMIGLIMILQVVYNKVASKKYLKNLKPATANNM